MTGILAVGDSYMSSSSMQGALAGLGAAVPVRFADVDPDQRPPLEGIHEYQGDPEVLAGWVEDARILVVHAAPVTRRLLEAHPSIRMVACLRGGPSNVDLVAARELGVRVTNTPGKNAESVADLTRAYVHLLLRRVGPAVAWLRGEAATGERHLDSTFIGGQWIAREPGGLTIGLVGLGAIGRLVAARALSDGMRVVAHDPFVTAPPEGVELLGLGELAATSDVVSIHAKATAETHHLVDATFLAGMRADAVLVNTSRQQLVDEPALLEALLESRIAGAALDVCEPDGCWPELSALPQVLVSPTWVGPLCRPSNAAWLWPWPTSAASWPVSPCATPWRRSQPRARLALRSWPSMNPRAWRARSTLSSHRLRQIARVWLRSGEITDEEKLSKVTGPA